MGIREIDTKHCQPRVMRAYWPSPYKFSEWGDSVEMCVGDRWDTRVGKIAVGLFLPVGQEKNGFDQKSLNFIFFSEKRLHVAQAGPEFVTFLSLPPDGWDYSHMLPCLIE